MVYLLKQGTVPSRLKTKERNIMNYSKIAELTEKRNAAYQTAQTHADYKAIDELTKEILALHDEDVAELDAAAREDAFFGN